MFEDRVEVIQEVFSRYFGNGRYLVVFIMALLLIAVEEKKKENKNFLVYYTVLTFAIILNPIFAKIISKIITDSIYFRVFWLIPMGIIIAYGAVILVSKLDKKVTKTIISVVFIILLMYAGDFVYCSTNFEKVNNWYKLPDEYVQVTKIIGDIPLKDKKIVTSTDMNGYIRQIDASIKLAFPRKPAGDYDKFEIVSFYYAGDVEKLTNLCKAENTNIIVFERMIPINANFSDFGFDLYAQTENYDVYVLREN